MNRQEFEAEFIEKIKSPFEKDQGRPDWFCYVDSNLYKLSDEALRYIISRKNRPFGDWLVERAIYLTVFEDMVLNGDQR